MNKNSISSLRWILSVSNRFASVDRKGKSRITSFLSGLGICLGVLTLIVVVSVMNGFQMSFINSILEISSFHIKASNVDQNSKDLLIEYCQNDKRINCVSSYLEAQTLMTSENGKESVSIVRAVDSSFYRQDEGFQSEMKMLYGSMDEIDDDMIVLGSSLARNLGVGTGDVINLQILSGGNDINLFSSNHDFTVSGIFRCGYSEINSSYAFINDESGVKYFGKDAERTYGIKIKQYDKDSNVLYSLRKAFPQYKFESWREYNKSFFSALKIEKNALMMLVAIIFLVVGINIFNGMRRLVFERKNEIAIFSAIGATFSEIKLIFVIKGLIIGVAGSLCGVIFGLLISVNTDFIFSMLSQVIYFFQYIFTFLFSRENLMFIQENSSFSLYASIPSVIYFREVLLICFFGIFSPVIASFFASENVLKMTVSEVLRNE
ncbi:MAG: ABC transporter permease [Treponema sp.]|jgi:lipoprotein-releasing system permease protein|nr:ABC transporter permease [Treponema sp.]